MWYNVRLLENVIIHLLETMHVKTEKDVLEKWGLVREREGRAILRV